MINKNEEILKELNEFLGSNYTINDCVEMKEKSLLELKEAGLDRFFGESNYYIFDLALWYLNSASQRYIITDNLIKFMDKYKLSTFYDFGSGIGLDLIPLIYAGFKHSYYDIKSRHLDFLNYRLTIREQELNYIEPEKDFRVDLVYSIAVFEHINQPKMALKQLLNRTNKYLALVIDPDKCVLNRNENIEFLDKLNACDEDLLKELNLKRIEPDYLATCFFEKI